jgi:hypothetical protein
VLLYLAAVKALENSRWDRFPVGELDPAGIGPQNSGFLQSLFAKKLI